MSNAPWPFPTNLGGEQHIGRVLREPTPEQAAAWPFPMSGETREQFQKRCMSPAARRRERTPEEQAAHEKYEAIKSRAWELVRENIYWDGGDVRMSTIRVQASATFTKEEIESDAFHSGCMQAHSDVVNDWPGGEYGDAPELILD